MFNPGESPLVRTCDPLYSAALTTLLFCSSLHHLTRKMPGFGPGQADWAVTAVVCTAHSSHTVGAPARLGRGLCGLLLAGLLSLSGCGTTKSQTGTEQLLLSNAVDLSIAQIDFTDLRHQKVYLDTSYVNNIKGVGFVNADYIISALRQQLASARCLLQEKREDADFIVEARVGALGGDQHDVTYGLPASNILSTAASIVPSMPSVPAIPELSIAKKSDQSAAAKVAVFAYHRETKEPVWQSGISQARATAKDVWVAGAGPFQSGTIYNGPRFAGEKIGLPFGENYRALGAEPVDYQREYQFADADKMLKQTQRDLAAAEAAKAKGEAAANAAAKSETQTAENEAGESAVTPVDHTSDDPPLPQLFPDSAPELFPEPELDRFLSHGLRMQSSAVSPWLQLETDPSSSGRPGSRPNDSMKFRWRGLPLLEPDINALAPDAR